MFLWMRPPAIVVVFLRCTYWSPAMFCQFRASLTVALILASSAPIAFGQCKNGGGGGGGGNRGGGGYPPQGNPQQYPPYGGNYPDPYGGGYPGGIPTYPSNNPYPVMPGGVPLVNGGVSLPTTLTRSKKPIPDVSSEETSIESLDSMMDETMEGVEWNVLVEHPIRGEFTKVKTFTKEGMARRFADSLKSRYWVVYSKPGDDSQKFEEATSAATAKSIMARLRDEGFKVEKPTPVTAKLMMNDITSLMAKLEEAKIEFGADSNEATSTPSADSVTETKAEPTPESTSSMTLDAALVPLLGMWKAVARDADGQLTTIELKLDANGWATLVMPSENGGTTSVERRVALENGELKLNGENSSVTLGKLANADANRLTLERPNGQVTFVRP
jgi:hypothetical protein